MRVAYAWKLGLRRIIVNDRKNAETLTIHSMNVRRAREEETQEKRFSPIWALVANGDRKLTIRSSAVHSESYPLLCLHRVNWIKLLADWRSLSLKLPTQINALHHTRREIDIRIHYWKFEFVSVWERWKTISINMRILIAFVSWHLIFLFWIRAFIMQFQLIFVLCSKWNVHPL